MTVSGHSMSRDGRLVASNEPRAVDTVSGWLPLRSVSLLWKLLIPFIGMMLLAGVLGAFVIVRDLSARAETALGQDLARRSLEARSLLRDRELYLLEAVNLASNLQGMAAAVEAGDKAAVARLLESVLTLKGDLALVAVVDRQGVTVEGFSRRRGAGKTQRIADSFAGQGIVVRALTDKRAEKYPGFVSIDGRTVLVMSGAVCSGAGPCAAVGAAVAGIDVTRLAAEAVAPKGGDNTGAGTGATIYDPAGGLLAASGTTPFAPPPTEAATRTVRRLEDTGAGDVATLYAPLEVRGTRLGTLAVTMPTAPAFSAVRGAGVRLAVILLLAMAGVLVIGVVLSRLILAQVRPLIETNRRLASGNLSARAAVLGGDELGELARGVNHMAEQLQASHETLEARVEERTDEIGRLLRERTEFFTGMSHELRTPLAVILGQAELLRDPPESATMAWAAGTGAVLEESGEQLLTLVNGILDLGQAEAGGVPVDVAPEHLADVVADLRGTIGALADANDLQTQIDVSEDLPPVVADRRRLREIILNLVDNATKYTPAGGTVELSAVASNGVVKVSVADTGVGIPDDIGARIFEPFYRAEGVRPQRGQPSSGLGLALTKHLVEAHGGDIDFTSTPGHGTTFTFTLPRAESLPEPSTSPAH